ncbi:MAG: hypothetical protein WAX07_00685 [Candidatus Altiarchaeia archaeon]
MRRAAKKILKNHGEPYTWKTLLKDILEVALFFAIILASLKVLLGANMPVPIVGVVSCSMIHEDDCLGGVGYSMAGAFPFLLPAPCTYNYSASWKEWIQRQDPSVGDSELRFKSGFAAGDLIVVGSYRGEGLITSKGINVGDVILFNYKKDPKQPGNEPLLHRVVGEIEVRGGHVTGVSGALDCFTRETFEDEFIKYVERCRSNWSLCPYRNVPEGDDYEFYLTKGDNNKISDQCSALIVPPIIGENVMEKAYLRIPLAGWLKVFIEYVFSFVPKI